MPIKPKNYLISSNIKLLLFESSVNEVWIKTVFYVFNTVFDGEYDGKLKKDKKNSPAGIWTHNFEKNSHFRKELLKKSHFKRVTKKEWYHMNRALETLYSFFVVSIIQVILISLYIKMKNKS